MLTVDLTKELIARDILVLTAGCSSGGLENCGLMRPEAAELAGPKLKAVCQSLGIPPVLNFGPCLAIGRLEMVATELASALGVDIPQLPLVLSAAQWLEEQALADGAFGLALGLPLHLGLPPFITGSSLVTKVLTEDMKAPVSYTHLDVYKRQVRASGPRRRGRFLLRTAVRPHIPS